MCHRQILQQRKILLVRQLAQLLGGRVNGFANQPLLGGQFRLALPQLGGGTGAFQRVGSVFFAFGDNVRRLLLRLLLRLCRDLLRLLPCLVQDGGGLCTGILVDFRQNIL